MAPGEYELQFTELAKLVRAAHTLQSRPLALVSRLRVCLTKFLHDAPHCDGEMQKEIGSVWSYPGNLRKELRSSLVRRRTNTSAHTRLRTRFAALLHFCTLSAERTVIWLFAFFHYFSFSPLLRFRFRFFAYFFLSNFSIRRNFALLFANVAVSLRAIKCNGVWWRNSFPHFHSW